MNFPQYGYLESYEDKRRGRYIEFLKELGSNVCFEGKRQSNRAFLPSYLSGIIDSDK